MLSVVGGFGQNLHSLSSACLHLHIFINVLLLFPSIHCWTLILSGTPSPLWINPVIPTGTVSLVLGYKCLNYCLTVVHSSACLVKQLINKQNGKSIIQCKTKSYTQTPATRVCYRLVFFPAVEKSRIHTLANENATVGKNYVTRIANLNVALLTDTDTANRPRI